MVQAIVGHTAIVTEQIVRLRLVERDIAAIRETPDSEPSRSISRLLPAAWTITSPPNLRRQVGGKPPGPGGTRPPTHRSQTFKLSADSFFVERCATSSDSGFASSICCQAQESRPILDCPQSIPYAGRRSTGLNIGRMTQTPRANVNGCTSNGQVSLMQRRDRSSDKLVGAVVGFAIAAQQRGFCAFIKRG
jgi:hypothetical protein